jgi:hypothetical protein
MSISVFLPRIGNLIFTMKKILILIFFCLAINGIKAQQLITSGEYWFDADYSNRNPIPVSPSAVFTFNAGINCASLTTGLHVLNTRFKQSNGSWSAISSQVFLKVPADNPGDNKVVACEYWLDNAYSSKTYQSVTPVSTFNLVSGITCNSLSVGIHVFNMRFRQSNGKWSGVISQLFMKVPPDNTGDNRVTAYEYWLDNAYASKIYQSVSPVSSFNLVSGVDCNSLSVGIHVFRVRFRQSNGKWSSLVSQLFMKVPPDNAGDNKMVAFEYWLDNSYAGRILQTLSPSYNSTIASVIDFSNIPNGIHTYNCRFKQSNGRWSSTLSQVFIKHQSLAGTNMISSYEYWFNSDFNSRVRINLPPSQVITTNNSLVIDTVTRFINVFHSRYMDLKGAWAYADDCFYSLNLDLKVFLEGLNDGSPLLMHPAMNESGPAFGSGIADTLTIEIYEGTFPYNILLRFPGSILHTDGSCQVRGHGANFLNYPGSTVSTYFIVLKHRNSIVIMISPQRPQELMEVTSGLSTGFFMSMQVM